MCGPLGSRADGFQPPLTFTLSVIVNRAGFIKDSDSNLIPEAEQLVFSYGLINLAAGLALASALGTSRPVEWRGADAMRLPFRDATFDAVVCQFRVTFFPEKAKAFSQARRVLGPGGVFIFNVWDSITENEFADTVTTALESLFPLDPSFS